MSVTFEDIGDAVSKILEDVGPVLPSPLQAPAKVVALVLRDVVGNERTLSVAAGATGAAAGAAAYKAAHLAGMREAIDRALKAALPNNPLADVARDAVMAEVLRRWPS